MFHVEKTVRMTSVQLPLLMWQLKSMYFRLRAVLSDCQNKARAKASSNVRCCEDLKSKIKDHTCSHPSPPLSLYLPLSKESFLRFTHRRCWLTLKVTVCWLLLACFWRKPRSSPRGRCALSSILNSIGYTPSTIKLHFGEWRRDQSPYRRLLTDHE